MSDHDIDLMIALRADGVPVDEIASKFEISERYAYRIVNGEISPGVPRSPPGTEMAALMRALGWKGVDLADRLEVDPNTVSRWKKKPPTYVMVYLEAMVALRDLRKKIEEV